MVLHMWIRPEIALHLMGTSAFALEPSPAANRDGTTFSDDTDQELTAPAGGGTSVVARNVIKWRGSGIAKRGECTC